MRFRIALSLLVGLLGVVTTGAIAYAHGENSQEGFLRMETVAFSNVQFSKDTIKQGEDVVITGRASLLTTWPKTLGEPETGFVNITAPGPVVLMKERLINGMTAPDAIFVDACLGRDLCVIEPFGDKAEHACLFLRETAPGGAGFGLGGERSGAGEAGEHASLGTPEPAGAHVRVEDPLRYL